MPGTVGGGSVGTGAGGVSDERAASVTAKITAAISSARNCQRNPRIALPYQARGVHLPRHRLRYLRKPETKKGVSPNGKSPLMSKQIDVLKATSMKQAM
jgi:hypothetical protein